VTKFEGILGRDDAEIGAWATKMGNLYFGGGTEVYYVHEQINPNGRDILELRITGTPEGGLEQTIRKLYRIVPSGQPAALTDPEPQWTAV
jgi:hypothetical protein